jgi:nitric oxide dioxygenase
MPICDRCCAALGQGWIRRAVEIGGGVGCMEDMKSIAHARRPRMARAARARQKKIMTPEQMLLLRMSFVSVMSRKAEAGHLFYERLFAIAPALRPLFKNDMDAQAHKFIEMLAIIIGLLNNPTSLSQKLTQLAHRHRSYGVRDEHFVAVGDALLWTLGEILGDAFTPELQAAWRDLYAMVASAMKRASPVTA